MPAELFFGLLRCGVPADAHVTVLASSTSGVDLAANAQAVLDGVLSTSATTVEAAIATAAATKLIPPSYASRAADDLANLAALGRDAALNSTQSFGKTSFANVLDAVSVAAQTQQRFIRLYTAAVGPARLRFWHDLAGNSDFSADEVASLRFGVLVGRLTRGYLPLINELADQRNSGRISDASELARLTTTDWLHLLQRRQPNGTDRRAVVHRRAYTGPGAASVRGHAGAFLRPYVPDDSVLSPGRGGRQWTFRRARVDGRLPRLQPVLRPAFSWDYWGLAQGATNSIVDPDDPTKTVTGTWFQVLAQVRVLLNRADLQYQDLAHPLNT